jgi:hypothetical protein
MEHDAAGISEDEPRRPGWWDASSAARTPAGPAAAVSGRPPRRRNEDGDNPAFDLTNSVPYLRIRIAIGSSLGSGSGVLIARWGERGIPHAKPARTAMNLGARCR